MTRPCARGSVDYFGDRRPRSASKLRAVSGWCSGPSSNYEVGTSRGRGAARAAGAEPDRCGCPSVPNWSWQNTECGSAPGG